MKIRIVNILASAACVFFLEACVIGGDGSSSSSAVIMPLSVGNYWEYVDSNFSSSGAFVDTTMLRISIRGKAQIQYQGASEEVFFEHYDFDPDSVDWLIGNGSDGLYTYGAKLGDSLFVVKKSLAVKFPVAPGDSWGVAVYSQSGGKFFYDSVETASRNFQESCVSNDSLYSTPVGTFHGYAMSSEEGVGEITTEFWVPNMGSVGNIHRSKGVITGKSVLRAYVAK